MSRGEQEAAAWEALVEVRTLIRDCLARLEPYMAALRERVIMALRLVQANGTGMESERTTEVAGPVRLLSAVAAEMPHAHEIGSKLRAFALLAENRGNHSDPAEVDQKISELAAEFESAVRGIQGRLKDFAYPFPHARGQLTVAEYARAEAQHEHEWVRAYQEANAHVDRLFALHYRLVGQVLVRADAAEKEIGNART